MKGKRGQMFEFFLIGAAFFVAITAVIAVIEYRSDVGGSLNPPDEVLDFYFNLDKFDYFHKEAGKLAIHDAFAIVSTSKADCKLVSADGLVQLWNDTCGPDNGAINVLFIEGVNTKFNEITGKKEFSIVVEGSKIKFAPTKIDSTVFVQNDFMKYNLTHKFGSEFSLEYPSLDFEGVHKDLVVDGKASTNGWKVASKYSGEYTVYTLTSEGYYFYDGKYGPAEMKFAVHKSL